jgi:hypothetical protein
VVLDEVPNHMILHFLFSSGRRYAFSFIKNASNDGLLSLCIINPTIGFRYGFVRFLIFRVINL